MIRLGVNVDHVATVRQARRTAVPSLVAAAHAAVLGGADLIKMHLREDRRHVQERDLELVRDALAVDLCVEMAATSEMVGIACQLKPHAVCLVPERREEITTEGGLDARQGREAIARAVENLGEAGIAVSMFVDPVEEALLAADEVGALAVELNAGRYANAKTEAARVHEHHALRRAAASARQLGLRVHAGHGLDYGNVARVAALPDVEELNVGFAIVARALFVGLTEAVREMKGAVLWAREIASRPEGP